MRPLWALALLLASPPSPVSSAGPPAPPLDELEDRAGRYVAALEEQLAVVVGNEEYSQSHFLGREISASHRRSLTSDVAWVPTGHPMVWAFYRDVRTVDGQPVSERGARLEALFPSGSTPAARELAQQILEESSRYNLGARRTVNSPTLALMFLHPRNQPRVRFRVAGRDVKEGVDTWKVRFAELQRPTLIRTTRGEDVPVRGLGWIEPGRGAIVASRLEMSPPGLGPVTIDVAFRLDARLDSWLPAEMRESYGNRIRTSADERVEALARYSSWRRAQVEVQDIVPVP